MHRLMHMPPACADTIRIPSQKKGNTPLAGAFPFLVRVTGFEPAASWSQTTRATSCATPGCRQKKLAPFRFRLSAKTAHALLPSSSPNRTRCAGLRFGKRGRRNSLRSVSALEETEKRVLQSLSIIHHSRRGSKRFFPKRGSLGEAFTFLSLMFLFSCVILA